MSRLDWIVDEQIRDWRRRRVSLAVAAESLGWRPPETWRDMRPIIVFEWGIAQGQLAERRFGARQPP